MRSKSKFLLIIGSMLVFVVAVISVSNIAAQSKSKKRKPVSKMASVQPTPTPISEPIIISRAEDYPVDGVVVSPAISDAMRKSDDGLDPVSAKMIADLNDRIKALESNKKIDYDQKQKRLALNLDILTKAEQRSESLRKQSFEMIEKENSIRTKMDSLEYDMRPENINRSIAFSGSLRPEELRAARKKSLESERANLSNLLAEIQRTRANIDLNLQRSEQMTERLRVKLEAEIEAAIEDTPPNP
ncbi:MAG: hypothetical protein ACRD6X_02965 [Pyrinomonadaceae bacterium]